MTVGALLLAGVAAASAAGPEPVRLATRAFGERVAVEVRDLPAAAADAAIRAALAKVQRLDRLVDPSGTLPGGVAELNAAAGEGPQPLDPELLPLLVRALEFCAWSNNAHGPLGAPLVDLWRRAAARDATPSPEALREAARAAACDRIAVDPEAGTVELAAGSALDLVPFAVGHAVDLAFDHLAEAGAGNLWVEAGGIARARGPGPRGEGWMVVLPTFPGMDGPLPPAHLDDRALAVRRAGDEPFVVAGEELPGLVDQRTPEQAPLTGRWGSPPTGVAAVAIGTERAVDAQALAGALFLLGSDGGRGHLGSLRPAPSVLWVLGGGGGEAPLLSTYRWARMWRGGGGR